MQIHNSRTRSRHRHLIDFTDEISALNRIRLAYYKESDLPVHIFEETLRADQSLVVEFYVLNQVTKFMDKRGIK